MLSGSSWRKILPRIDNKPINGIMFDHYPVDIKTFIDSPEYLDCGKECWHEIKKALCELFDLDPFHKNLSTYHEFVFNAGIGSGKSYLISLLFSYIIYRLMCFRSPQEVYGLARGSKIALVNMSKNAMQARKVVFGEITARIDNSPWFRANGMPDTEIRSELRMPKDILVLPGNSEETFPLGFNVFTANMDEASFFTETDTHDVAEEIYLSLSRRIKSRYRECGLLGITSSPRYEEDFIERKCEEGKTAKHILVKTIETWNSKPEDVVDIYEGRFFEIKHPRSEEMIKIPLRYKYDFEKNPDKSWRDYGAVASMVLEPYFKQFDLVMKCVDKECQCPINEYGVIADWFKGKPSYYYYIHVDLALTTDACGIAMAHKERDDSIVVDLIHRITGSPEKEIDISEVRALIVSLKAKGFILDKVTFDQFQSASIIQELNKQNIDSEKLSVDATVGPYETLKELCYTNKVKMYYNAKLIEELKYLELVKGKKIDHPPKGSKDVADAVCGAVFNAVNGEGYRGVTMKIL